MELGQYPTLTPANGGGSEEQASSGSDAPVGQYPTLAPAITDNNGPHLPQSSEARTGPTHDEEAGRVAALNELRAAAVMTHNPKKEEEEHEMVGCKALAAKAAKKLESPKAIIGLAIFSIALGIYSIAAVVSAYNALADANANVQDLVNNWRLIPIQQVGVTPVGTSCPNGWEYWSNTRSWPGAKVTCVCKDGARDTRFHRNRQYTESGTCTANQTRAGCEEDGGLPRIQLDRWRDNTNVCIKRGGPPVITGSKPPYTERPYPDAEGSCGDGWKACGTGSWDTTRMMCMPVAEPCPVVDIAVLSSTEWGNQSSSGYWEGFSAFSTAPTSHGVAWSRANLSETATVPAGRPSIRAPTVNAKMALGQVCTGTDGAVTYDGAGKSIKAGYTNSYDDRCGGALDTRYVTVDSQAETNFLQDVFDATSYCGSPTSRNPDLPTSVCGDCGDTACTRACLNDCDRLGLYAGTASRSWALMSRGELYWKQDCPTTRGEVVENAAPLGDATDLQHTLMILNIIANVVVIIIQCLMIMNVTTGDIKCIPGSGAGERKIIKFINTWVAGLMKLGKVIPLIIVTVLIAGIRHFFAGAADDACGDSITASTLEYLGDRLSAAYSGNIQTAVVDVIQLLIAIWTIIKELTDGIPLMAKARGA